MYFTIAQVPYAIGHISFGHGHIDYCISPYALCTGSLDHYIDPPYVVLDLLDYIFPIQ